MKYFILLFLISCSSVKEFSEKRELKTIKNHVVTTIKNPQIKTVLSLSDNCKSDTIFSGKIGSNTLKISRKNNKINISSIQDSTICFNSIKVDTIYKNVEVKNIETIYKTPLKYYISILVNVILLALILILGVKYFFK